MPLWEVLAYSRYAKASNLRDKVYGTLGIYRVKIKPGYNKDLVDVFREATVTCFKELEASSRPKANIRCDIFYHDPFSMLTCVDHAPGTGELARKPSWVPDWSQQRSTTALAFRSSASNSYSSGSWYEDACFELTSDQRTLCLKDGSLTKYQNLPMCVLIRTVHTTYTIRRNTTSPKSLSASGPEHP
jgi:hypothetical protein